MITVCMATYNGRQYIHRQMESILSQIGRDDEVVVSDDGSDDGTLDEITAFNDTRIRTVRNQGQHSPAGNFENALQHAKGQYIFLADQDDVWMPGKVRMCMEALKTHDCVVSDAIVTDSKLNVKNRSLFDVMHTRHGRLYNLLWHNGYTGCCMAFRRCVLDTALPFPPNIPMHDIWIGNVAAFMHSVIFIDSQLVLFRRHEHAASCNCTGSQYSTYRKIMFRLHTIKALLALATRLRTTYQNITTI